MLSKAAKRQIIDQLSTRFKSSPSIFVLGYQGLNVNQIELLRKGIKDADAELKVVKNTLLQKASKNTDIEKITDLFQGPTAIAICEKNSSKVAKIFIDNLDNLPALKIKGGIFEGKVVDFDKIKEISKLQSKQKLIANFATLLSIPMSNLVFSLKQMQVKIVFALNSIKDSKVND